MKLHPAAQAVLDHLQAHPFEHFTVKQIAEAKRMRCDAVRTWLDKGIYGVFKERHEGIDRYWSHRPAPEGETYDCDIAREEAVQ